MPIIDYLWGEAFGQLNLIQSLADIHKPVFIGLGRYDYLVAPVSLWDSIDYSYENVKKVIFEHSGHNPMYGTKMAAGLILHPNKAYIEIKIQLYNPSSES